MKTLRNLSNALIDLNFPGKVVRISPKKVVQISDNEYDSNILDITRMVQKGFLEIEEENLKPEVLIEPPKPKVEKVIDKAKDARFGRPRFEKMNKNQLIRFVIQNDLKVKSLSTEQPIGELITSVTEAWTRKHKELRDEGNKADSSETDGPE